MNTLTTVTPEELDTAIRAMGRQKWNELWANAKRPSLGPAAWGLIIVSTVCLLLEILAIVSSPSIRKEDLRALSELWRGLVDLGYLKIPLFAILFVREIRNYRQVDALRKLLETTVAEGPEKRGAGAPASVNP